MTSRDWGGLRAIVDEARALEETNANAPLVACPLCGTPLAIKASGERSCPMGHFRTTDTTLRNWL